MRGVLVCEHLLLSGNVASMSCIVHYIIGCFCHAARVEAGWMPVGTIAVVSSNMWMICSAHLARNRGRGTKQNATVSSSADRPG